MTDKIDSIDLMIAMNETAKTIAESLFHAYMSGSPQPMDDVSDEIYGAALAFSMIVGGSREESFKILTSMVESASATFKAEHYARVAKLYEKS